ncbi:MAG: M36 family metallopeptidase, partial [Chloroflexota bacterium]|nr:M36 family metallopeptidase [Chloroflexota bacterium]
GIGRAGRTDGFLTGDSDSDPAKAVLGYVRARQAVFGLDAGDVGALSLDYRYASWDGVTHLFFVQASHGVPSYDTGLEGHVTKDGRIVAISARAVPDFGPAPGPPRVSAGRALGVAKRNVGGRLLAPRARTRRGPERQTSFANGDRAGLVVFADRDGERLAWKVTVTGADGLLYQVVVDARRGSILARRSLTDFLANASVYNNYPGAPGGGAAVTFDLEAPESGAWLNLAGSPRAKLDGNNAHAYADVNNSNVADAGEEVPPNDGINYTYPRTPFTQAGCPAAGCAWNSSNTATKTTNKNQVTTQLFYFTNKFHDWLIQPPVGFDEASRNFEHVNSSGMGLGGDRLNAEANDGGGTNNANFNTPADGIQPRVQMYFTDTGGQSMNTGDDASVVFHEYTHGLTNRLVGNGSGLNALQSGSMGEGWSDWYALDYLVFNSFETDTAAPGELKTGRHSFPPNGVRTEATDCPVGASVASCPGTAAAGSGGYTLGDIGKVGAAGSVHANGEIWAQTLWDLRNAVGSDVARGIVTGGLRLSANNPSFLTMRDSILQADRTSYGGAHYNAIWQVFAARGMGYNASTPSAGAETATQDFSLPPVLTAGTTTLDDAAPLGDGDGVAEPGETIKLTQALANPAPSAVNNVNGTLSTTTSGVTIGQATASWGNIAGGASATNTPPLTFTVPASHTCGAPVQLSLAMTTSAGNLTIPKTIPTGTPGVRLNNTPLPIPDANAAGANSTINVPAGASIADLNVQIRDLRHSYVGDLKMTLKHPDGTTVTLMDRPGAGTFGSSADDFIDLVLDDEATNQIDTIGTTGPITGSWKPDQALAAFDGKPRAGTWTLNVSDNAGGDVGTLNSWGLDFGDPTQCNASTPPPDAVTTAASAITTTGATLNGTIDPNGTATDYRFEYGTTASYGSQTTAGSAGSGDSPAAQSAAVGSLAPNTLYHFRIVAIRGGSVVATGADQTFTTLALPDAVTTAASAITTTGATLNGAIDPNGTATDYRFEYGTTASYGMQTPTESGGAGPDPVARSAPIAGLQPSTDYHYRVVALRGGAVVATGADASFTTQAAGRSEKPGAQGGGGANPPTPLVTFSAAKSIRVSRTGSFLFSFLASPPGSAGEATFTSVKAVLAARRKRKLTLVHGSFTVPADGQVKLKQKLSRKNLDRLRRLKRIKTSVQIELSGTRFKTTLTLRAPKRKRR